MARLELKNLLNDMDVYTLRLEKLLLKAKKKSKEIPYVDKPISDNRRPQIQVAQ